MNQINNTYYVILVLFIILVIYLVLVNRKLNEYFGVRCDEIFGCYDESDPTITEFANLGDCEDKCYFTENEDSSACERVTSQSANSYKSKYSCENRYNCDEDAGRCILAPGGEYSTLAECNGKCKWLKNDDSTNCIKDPAADPDPNGFNTKEECENRYVCFNGQCRQIAGAIEGDGNNEFDKVYTKERYCRNQCNLGDYDNNPMMFFTFDKNIPVSNNNIEESFKEQLERKIVGRGGEISRSQLLEIKAEQGEQEIIIIFSDDLRRTNNLRNIFDSITRDNGINTFKIISNFIEYNLIKVSFNNVDRMIMTSPALSTQDNLLFLEIKNIRNSYTLNNLDYTNLALSENSDKVEALTMIQQNSDIKKLNNYKIPNIIFINKKTGASNDEFYYETDDRNVGKYIKIRELNDDLIEKIRLQGYLDYNLIKYIYDNNKNPDENNIRIAILGEREPNNIFTYYNEFFLILYSTPESKFKYKQINVDLNLMKLMKPVEEKKVFNDDNINEIFDLSLENYKRFISTQEQLNGMIIRTNPTESEMQAVSSNNISNSNKNFKPLLFDNYYSGLRFEFNLSVRQENVTIDILPYTEDRQPTKDELECSFIPSGETKFQCIQMCENDSSDNNCSRAECSSKCNNCGTLKCAWNISDYNRNKTLKPEAPVIKCFSGDRTVKVTWLKPLSMFPIDKYYIILSNSYQKILNIYKYDSLGEINEFIIDKLDNNAIYNISIIAKNKFGVSERSNTESIIPNKNNMFERVSEIRHSDFEDTLESYYKNNYEDLGLNNPVDFKQQLSFFEQEVVKNDLKEILIDKLVPDKNIKQYKINIY